MKKNRRGPIWVAKVASKLEKNRRRPIWDGKAAKIFKKKPPEANMEPQSCETIGENRIEISIKNQLSTSLIIIFLTLKCFEKCNFKSVLNIVTMGGTTETDPTKIKPASWISCFSNICNTILGAGESQILSSFLVLNHLIPNYEIYFRTVDYSTHENSSTIL